MPDNELSNISNGNYPMQPYYNMNPGYNMLQPGGIMPQAGIMNPIYNQLEEFPEELPGTARPDDPPPILTNNPPQTSIVLHKELSGYSNYGNPSGNADILYTGNRGVWTFQIPAFLFVPGNLSAQMVISAVLDDHQNVPVRDYSATIVINGATVHTGRLPLEHGTPAGQQFRNWRNLTFDISQLRRTNRVVITNTSQTGPNDWIGFDWIELRMRPR